MQRVLFLASANNGLTQRAAAALRTAGHSVRTAVVATEEQMLNAVAGRDFDVIICPFLKAKIPATIWRTWPTIIVHPGPIGDRGASSLDWAITDAETTWGVTALSAVDEMDAGPIWAYRTFQMPIPVVRKSSLYNGRVADAAIECILEVAAKAADPTFLPVPVEQMPRPVTSARLRPTMTQADRFVEWNAPTSTIARAIHAADGSPGLLSELAGAPVFLYDARPARAALPTTGLRAGTIIGRRHGAVRIATGDGSIWIGHMRPKITGTKTFKLPATQVLTELGVNIEQLPVESAGSYRNIHYNRVGAIGYLTFDFYNGAMSTSQCRRLFGAMRYARAQDTSVLVLQGGWDYFSNGIHLNVIEAAENPAMEAWANIKAINAVCREIITCTNQVVVAAFTGNAGAGGVMLPLGADIVVARSGTVLNPHYATMGLYGSELHTYTLPRRVGGHAALRLTHDCLPIGASTARDIGLVDHLGPRDQQDFSAWLAELSEGYAAEHLWRKMLTAKESVLAEDAQTRPLDAYEAAELGEMAQDMFTDRNDFAQLRRNFVLKL